MGYPATSGVRSATGIRASTNRGQRRWWWWEQGVRVTRAGGDLVMWSTDWHGKPKRVAAIPDVPPDGRDPHELIEGLAMSLLRKADRPNPDTVPMATLVDPGFAAKHPMLWHYLTQTQWDDGSPRQTSSLLIFLQDGSLKAMLRDRDAGLCLWCAGQSVSGLLAGLEQLLVTPGVDWRVDRAPGQQQPAARKKRT